MSDVTLTLGVDSGSLKSELQSAIDSAVAEIKPIKLKADSKALSTSLGKIKVEVDQQYLRQQVQQALNDLGKFVNGSGNGMANITGKLFNTNIKGHAAEYNKLLGTLKQVGKLQADISGSKFDTTNVSGKLAGEAGAINQLAEAARSGKMSLEAFNQQRDAINKRVANYSADVEAIKAAEKHAEAVAKQNEANQKAAERQAAVVSRSETTKFNNTIQQLNLVKQGYSEYIRVQNLLAQSSSAKGTQVYNDLKTEGEAILNNTKALEQNKIGYREAKTAISASSAEIKKLEQNLRSSGSVSNSLSDKLQRFKQHLTTITSIVRAFQMLRMVIRPVVNAVTEVDTALTQLRIVTNANDQAMQAYGQTIMAVASRTAGSVKDLINSTTTFARLGYDLGESSKLAEYTQMLENVGAIDESSATSAMTAIIKAYGVQADDLESIMDRLVTVGNNFPISVSELAEGMNNAGSMLSMATGKNLDQSLALLTAANTTIQNISKSSTGLRTVLARLRNVKTELDEVGEAMTPAEYDNIVKALTKNNVALTDQNGNLRNSYEVLSDLSEAWKNMSESEQAALAKTLSGTRQQNVFASLMNNFNEASNSMKEMEDSEGALTKANNKYLDSVQAHIQQLKNAFVEFSQSAITADTIKKFTDLAKGLLKVVSAVLQIAKAVGGLRTIVPLITAFFAVLKGQSMVASLQRMSASIKAFASNARQSFAAARTAISNFGTSMTATATTTVSAAQAINSALGVIGIAAAIASAIVSGIQAIINKVNEARQNRIDKGVEAVNYINEIEDAYESYNELTNSGTASTDDLVASLDSLYKSLGKSGSGFENAGEDIRAYKEEIEKLIIDQEKLKLIDIFSGLTSAKEKAEGDIGDVFEVLAGNLQIRDYGDGTYLGALDSFFEELGLNVSTKSSIDEWVDAMDEIEAKMLEVGEASNFKASGLKGDKFTALKIFYDDLKVYLGDVIDLSKEADEATAEINKHTLELAFESPEINEAVQKIEDAYSQLNDLEVPEDKTVFGNIDLNNRDVLEWTDETLAKFDTAINEWGNKAETLRGQMSTVMGTWDTFDGVDIAFSPLLQTDDGPVLLTKETMSKYINKLIKNAGEDWTSEDLFKLDAEGLEIDGYHIQNMLADIGTTARDTSEAMDYLGKGGELSNNFYDIRDALIDTIMATDEFTGSQADAAAVVDEFLSKKDGFSNFYNAASSALSSTSNDLLLTAQGFQGLNDVINGTSTAAEELKAALSKEDYGDGLSARVENYKKLLEESEEGNWGGKHYAAYADYFGIDISKSVEKQKKQIQRLGRYFSEENQGLLNFFDDLENKGSEALEKIGVEFDRSKDIFSWDPTKLQEFADAMNIPKEALTDLLGLYIQKTPPSEWMKLQPDQLGSWLEADGIISNVNGTLTLSKAKLDELASGAGLDSNELIAKLQEIDRYSSMEIDTSSPEQGIDTLNEKLTTQAELIDHIDGRDIRSTLSMNGLDSTTARMEHLYSMWKEMDGGSVNSGPVSKPGNNNNTPKDAGAYASGTKGAKGGLALLGDEPSASGKPRPELVVSKGRAYLAGVNGPVVRKLNAGDIVYTYKQTKKILGDKLDGSIGIPAYKDGTEDQMITGGHLSSTLDGLEKAAAKAKDAVDKASGKTGSTKSSNTSGSDSTNSKKDDKDNWFERQYKRHNHLRNMDKESTKKYLNWLNKAYKKARKQGLLDLDEYRKYEEEVYKLGQEIIKEKIDKKKHLIEMDQLSEKKYYKWLDKQSKKWYKSGKINLEDYRKYQEEVYKGMQSVVKDYFNDLDHKYERVNKRTDGKNVSALIGYDEQGMRKVEKEIAKAKKKGLDNNSDWVQELQSQWWKYYEDRKKLEDDVSSKAKSAYEELVEFRVRMLKQELDNEKDTLNDRLKNLQDFYSRQKELLQESRDEEKYLEEQAEKRKAVTDIEIQLAQLEFDNSAWATKRKLELEQKLADARKDLDDFEKDHAIEAAQDTLDKMQELQEKEINDRIDALDKQTDDELALYQQARADIATGSKELYEEMIAWNDVYGDHISENVTNMWNEAYTALEDYYNLYGEYYKDTMLGYGESTHEQVDDSAINAGYNSSKSKDTKSGNAIDGTTKQAKNVASSISKDVASTVATEALKTLNILSGESQTTEAVASEFSEGVASAVSEGVIDALNGLTFISSDGATYTLLSGSNAVGKTTQKLSYNYTNGSSSVTSALLSGLQTSGTIRTATVSQNISLGDIYINGNASDKTVSEIRREKRAEMDYMLKELSRLSK